MQLNVFQLAYNGPTGPKGDTGFTGPVGVVGPAGPTTIAAVSPQTIYTVGEIDATTLPTGINSTLITLPDTTFIVIKSNNNSLNRFINSMSGGVQGRHIIFMYDPDSPTNEYIQFNESSTLSGTGITIAGRTTSNISISAGGIITFIFWNNYWRYHA